MLQENKARKIFRKTDISYPLIRMWTCMYQRVRNIRFSENSPFWLITDELWTILRYWLRSFFEILIHFFVLNSFLPISIPMIWILDLLSFFEAVSYFVGFLATPFSREQRVFTLHISFFFVCFKSFVRLFAFAQSLDLCCRFCVADILANHILI